jgi:hypothetical protein
MGDSGSADGRSCDIPNGKTRGKKFRMFYSACSVSTHIVTSSC